MSEELKPCPDGHQTAKVANWPNSVGEWKFYAYCTCCGWRSGQAETEAEAITAWNRRAAAPDLHKALGEALEALKPFALVAEMEAVKADGESVIVNVSLCRRAHAAIASLQKVLGQVEGGQ